MHNSQNNSTFVMNFAMYGSSYIAVFCGDEFCFSQLRCLQPVEPHLPRSREVAAKSPPTPNMANPFVEKSHYETLGVLPTALPREIKHKYRKLALAHHPDKGGDEALFKQIT